MVILVEEELQKWYNEGYKVISINRIADPDNPYIIITWFIMVKD